MTKKIHRSVSLLSFSNIIDFYFNTMQPSNPRLEEAKSVVDGMSKTLKKDDPKLVFIDNLTVTQLMKDPIFFRKSVAG